MKKILAFKYKDRFGQIDARTFLHAVVAILALVFVADFLTLHVRESWYGGLAPKWIAYIAVCSAAFIWEFRQIWINWRLKIDWYDILAAAIAAYGILIYLYP